MSKKKKKKKKKKKNWILYYDKNCSSCQFSIRQMKLFKIFKIEKLKKRIKYNTIDKMKLLQDK